ncbi:MAG: hypothetical protein ALECFALPRED_007481 [Alectoria fallacina]|uniref:Uncharacterized protein n=1 Tax=Alectoria fallacina TaxID=1903189 RepID=A0A8H3J0C4_9LECA|nr:MAG: hypothetical protein ALECFALPRED_007481 [Alectoria fallacina]
MVNMRRALVPIVADEMSLWIPGEEDAKSEIIHGQATGELRGLRGAYTQTQVYGTSGENLMDIKQLRCASYDGTSPIDDKYAAARNPYLNLVWKPDFDSLSNEQAKAGFPPTTEFKYLAPTFEKPDRLAAYILIKSYVNHSDLYNRSHSEHLQRF